MKIAKAPHHGGHARKPGGPAVSTRAFSFRLFRGQAPARGRVISNRAALVDYCRELIGGEALESFRVICVDAQCRLLGESEISSGTLSEVAAYPRKIATIALLMNAHSVFLAHNHPGGTCAPSREDIASTMRIKSLLGQMDILVLDHCIVTPDGGSYSMAQHGDL